MHAPTHDLQLMQPFNREPSMFCLPSQICYCFVVKHSMPADQFNHGGSIILDCGDVCSDNLTILLLVRLCKD